MLTTNNKGARSQRARLLVSLGAVLTATALSAACGDDGDDTGSSGGAAGAGGSSGSAGTNGSSGGTIGIGGQFGQGGTDGLPQGGSCDESNFEADPIPVSILLVIDKSGSMDADLGDSTRWGAMKDAVNAAVEGSQESISYGLLLYPDDSSCGVPGGPNVAVEAGTDAAGDISTELDGATPSGATPTAAALEAAFDYFDSGAGADLEGEKYVLLATDGGPNCHAGGGACDIDACTLNIEEAFNSGTYPACDSDFNCCGGDESQCLDDADTLAAVTKLQDAGVKTIVVGIPGTEAYADLLDDLAVAGGSPNPNDPPNYYAVEEGDATGLQEVLESITMGLIKDCEFQLHEEPPDRDLLNVEVDDVRLLRDDPDGWELDTSTDPPTVVLLGEACEIVKTVGAEKVEVLFGCMSDIPR
jgi:hypothetical protein